MGIPYAAFCLILFVAFTLTCFRQKLPKWWPVVVLAFPPAAPVFVLRSKKVRSGPWIALTLAGLIVVAGVETYFYRDYKEKNKYSHLPPVVREMIKLNEASEASTIEIYYATGKLDSMGLVQSRISDIRTTLGLLENMRVLLE